MCVIYIIACLVVLAQHAGEVPGALVTIVREAFSMEAGFGGFIGGLIQGIRRGVFSNEAGVGSAAIAHSAVKTRKPASEGVVALLEPFVDTVVVCTMTALVIVVTGMWKVNSDVKVESLTLLDQPVAGASAAATYEEGVMLKVKGKWQEATAKESGKKGWIPAGAAAEDKENKGVFTTSGEVALLEKPGEKAEVATLAEGSEVTLNEVVWAQVHHPDEDKTGWVSFADLNDRANFAGGIWLTSQAFAGVISWFPKVLTLAVFLFAFSTMISWSYYGQQALGYLVKERGIVVIIYKVIFCGCVVLGSAASLGSVIDISDSLFFAMVVPNMIGLHVLLPVVKEELQKFREHVAEIDAKDS
jgi:AGCS family alanine or glycine:cation symporter